MKNPYTYKYQELNSNPALDRKIKNELATNSDSQGRALQIYYDKLLKIWFGMRPTTASTTLCYYFCPFQNGLVEAYVQKRSKLIRLFQIYNLLSSRTNFL